MAERAANALGAIDPITGKVSTGRVILYLSIGLFFLAFAYVGVEIGFRGAAWSNFEGWIAEFVSGIKWFLAPYLGGAVRDAVVAKKTDVA